MKDYKNLANVINEKLSIWIEEVNLNEDWYDNL